MAKKQMYRHEDLMTQAQAAERRKVTLAAINELVQRKRLRVVEMFGRRLLIRAEVEGFAKLKTGPKGGGKPAGSKPNRKGKANRTQTKRKPKANRTQTKST
jgi:hypothetical protein